MGLHFPSLLSLLTLCFCNFVYLSKVLSAQLTIRAPELNLNKVTPSLASRGPEKGRAMGDQDREKMAGLFLQRKKKKDREPQGRKKFLEGDSEESEGTEHKRKEDTGLTQT